MELHTDTHTGFLELRGPTHMSTFSLSYVINCFKKESKESLTLLKKNRWQVLNKIPNGMAHLHQNDSPIYTFITNSDVGNPIFEGRISIFYHFFKN